MKLTCICGCEFEPRTGDYNRALKNAKKMYCSRTCFSSTRKINHTSGSKICNECKKEFPIEKFRQRKQNGTVYRIAKCRKCETKYNTTHRDNEKRRLRENYRFSDPEKRRKKNAYQREWRNSNIKLNRAYHKKHIKKQVDRLSDIYILRSLTRKKILIPFEVIEAKRIQLKIKRIIKLKNYDTKPQN